MPPRQWIPLDRLAERARLLKALGNLHRLHILHLLADRELSVGQLNEHVDLSQSALSQHLAVMRREGLVVTRRASQVIYYRVNEPLVQPMLNAMSRVDGHGRTLP